MEITAYSTTAKRKNHRPEAQFRHALDTCSKNNDLPGALALYQSADSKNIHLSAYHFNSLLHIFSSSLETLEKKEPTKQSVIENAFCIFDRMVATGATPTEATVTTMARIAARRPDSGGNMAFDLVKTMGDKYGATPKLRTYGPALFTFCRNGEAEKAYSVEEHMASKGVSPEEAEIAALLEVSARDGRGERVYGYLQKLRSCLGGINSSTATVLENWFSSEQAVEVGSLNWDADRVKDAILVNGGGFHGLGWLGSGGWEFARGTISVDGHCSCCGLRLLCVDIDQRETEKFAESVAGLAMERETRANFSKFQEWLDNHTFYEAVIDGANVALYQQNFADGGFSLSQLNVVVGELQRRNQGKWPLIIIHSKRYRVLMDNPANRQLLETWSAAGALYTTPNGSNDDWYWLYAAVKLRCLLVTNDEMRDHIFELLGRSFFPKWKERHQVKYSFVKGDLVLKMPPPYSLVIQESETGSWHVPLDENSQNESSRTWLCITRPASSKSLEVRYPRANHIAAVGIHNGEYLCYKNGTNLITRRKRKERSP
ncbi:proteinaceous RNase P 2 [Phalaenopsis equestris]|uniref:proteinaceous RNase P 2 n=1 Tax=Phalaenopsis equestris TaxID=78828 RepID=UPI0009E24E6A|nr:proteinaceous RNase P 2 [Phalaenopsis equestris]